jgi:ABC-type multidrug transport system ATPase subunit
MHDLNLASRYCDRVALLSGGTVTVAGDPDDLTAETIESVYDVEVTIARAADRRLVVPERPVIGDGASADRSTIEAMTNGGSGGAQTAPTEDERSPVADGGATSGDGTVAAGDDPSPWWRRLLNRD